MFPAADTSPQWPSHDAHVLPIGAARKSLRRRPRQSSSPRTASRFGGTRLPGFLFPPTRHDDEGRFQTHPPPRGLFPPNRPPRGSKALFCWFIPSFLVILPG